MLAASGTPSPPAMSGERAIELRLRIGRAAAVFAIEGSRRTRFYRDNLARAMRRGLAAGLPVEEVIALSVLPRREPERLLTS